ncbi:hypothetical protein, partial [Cellulomonas endophytica]|uniref:hypothetical protein n=1 Tax=Cellulomonas endophytica TaxID=2494735 RepID=UPI00196A5833
ARGALPLLAAARAAEGARAALPAVAVAALTGLATLGLVVGATVAAGQEAGAWAALPGDARVRSVPGGTGGSGAPLPARLLAGPEAAADAPGVVAAAAGRVEDGVQLRGEGWGRRGRVVAVDSAAFAALTRATAAPDVALPVPGPGDGAALPALVTASVRDLGTTDLRLGTAGARVALRAVGDLPVLVADAPLALLVDAAALAEASGQAVEPTTVWLAGPGAGAAARAAAAGGPGEVEALARGTLLAERRAAPLVRGTAVLVRGSTAALAVLLALAVVLVVAAGAPERRATLARLGTLGLPRGALVRVALGELVPTTALAAAGGLAVGLLTAALVVGPLSLRLLTGQAVDPSPVLPVAALVPLTVAAAAAATAALATVVGTRDPARRPIRPGSSGGT